MPAGLGSKSSGDGDFDGEGEGDGDGDGAHRDPPPPPRKERQRMEGERTLLKGILSSEADFEVLVTGPVGVREIERLIRKLEFDKEILAEKSVKIANGDDE